MGDWDVHWGLTGVLTHGHMSVGNLLWVVSKETLKEAKYFRGPNVLRRKKSGIRKMEPWYIETKTNTCVTLAVEVLSHTHL